jgi:hypothetical protein
MNEKKFKKLIYNINIFKTFNHILMRSMCMVILIYKAVNACIILKLKNFYFIQVYFFIFFISFICVYLFIYIVMEIDYCKQGNNLMLQSYYIC